MPTMWGNFQVINVVDDYNATGKGITDDSTAINNALAAVPVQSTPLQNGAIVFFPYGTYLISKPLIRKVPFTRMVGQGKSATTILLDASAWQGIVSPADPVGAFMLDLQSMSVTDCTVEDLTIDGNARMLSETDKTKSANYSGVLCATSHEVRRVGFYDIWGYGLWIFGPAAAHTRVIDCEADQGLNLKTNTGGNDCIGGGAYRSKIVRFYWMPGLLKNTALDFTNGGGTSFSETSVDVIDCINESPRDVVLEGCVQSTIRGNRFYGNTLGIKSDGAYAMHPKVTNPADILVADNLFAGQYNAQLNQWIGGSCLVTFDGGTVYCPNKPLLNNNGGRIAILGNSFINSAGGNPAKAGSAIRWSGDDQSNSDGGSIISGNRIINPNANGVTSTANVPGDCGGLSLGDDLGCGIAILSSYGLTIGRNTINDTNSPQKMQYAMQLFSSTGLPSGASTQRIIVTENLCGSAPGVGNGSKGTFSYNQNPTGLLPSPILQGNTNQDAGYDANASSQILSGPPTGAPWPIAGGYPYDAIITISGGSGVEIDLGVTDTKLQQGAFFLRAGQHINIKWGATQPIVKVFRI